MKTYDELQKENADLTELLHKVTNQLTLALDQVSRDHTAKMRAKSEWHHRKFEELCPIPPIPDMSDLVILK